MFVLENYMVKDIRNAILCPLHCVRECLLVCVCARIEWATSGKNCILSLSTRFKDFYCGSDSHVDDDNLWLHLPHRRHAVIGNENSIEIEERVQSEIEYPKRLIYLYSPLHGDLCAENSSACSGRQHMRIRSVVRPVRVAYIDCCQAHMECVYQETIFPVFIKFKNSTWGHRIHRIYTMLIYNNMLYLEYWNMRCC